jgi:copper chaperone CopZ
MRFTTRSLSLAIFVLLFACSPNEQQKSISKSTQSNKVVPNQILVAEVEGMVCKMGCGGAIRKELVETKAVSRVEIDYQEGSQKQTIKVHFDTQLISETQIVRKLEKINNKQFKVYPIGTSEIESSSSGASSAPGVNMSETSYELPNLIGILSSFITE